MKSLLLLVAILFVGCKNSSEPETELLIGTWVQDEYFADGTSYLRTSNLADDKSSYIFNSDRTLVDRKISGRCASPPIYKNYFGTWENISPDTIRLYTETWIDLDTIDYEILELNSKNLKLGYISSY